MTQFHPYKVQEYRKSKRKLNEFKEWRIAQIRRDLDFCHPMRPHERTYIDEEVRFTEDEKLYYWSGWNIYDWVVILMLFVTIVLHIIAGWALEIPTWNHQRIVTEYY